MKRFITIIIITFIAVQFGCAQPVPEDAAANTIKKIKEEETKNPLAINYVTYLADVTGSRITWSPGFNKSVDWAADKLTEIGLKNSHIEEWEPYGKSWEVKRVVLNQVTPYFSNLIASPKHFSPGTSGVIKGRAVYIDAKDEAGLEKYKGKLKGAIVFVLPVLNLRLNFDPFLRRYTDEDIKNFRDAVIPSDEEKKKEKELKESNEKYTLDYFRFANKRIEFCLKEGAAAMVEYGGRIYGTNQGLSALLPVQLKDLDELFYVASRPDAPKTIPQILLSLEQYNSIVRTLKSGVEVNMEAEVEVENNKVLKGKNVIAEIPGTDLKNEVVIIGAHIDTQGPSIGATDNAVGVAVCMEAMRILKQIDARPRRTIRICLWGGEEQGYLGSKAYVEKHFANNTGGEKCYMYFNTDNGAGRFRGIYMEERSDLAPVMQKWFDKIDMKLVTSISKTDHTDHQSFNAKGIPGFQFIQDMLDYMRIYHTNMDRIERIPVDDVKDNAIIMAGLAYLAAIE